ncbi:MAG: hypothetical protein OQJ93_06670 [Ignavibacteriaceae bacterium]|jgi:hypothetical protein|nr:hypothetical protein [Ignavibacteriaceae bacterium]MCW8814345.1 hypothetical protein [Chlorobium sp.]MCW8823002.1 hypothetical protein [Ignavibacteriaceae bacterium]MCW8961523.1 hypothetical protein [Ignavibacteriaceae bacterium]MCW9095535.1 hypothetical protein [Ignavibacteriaceae bacterium]
MKKYSLIVILPIILVLLSCGRKEYTEQGIKEIKKEIDSLLYNPDAEEHFNWGSAKAYSNFRAYFHNSKLIFINEDYRFRQSGDSFNRYYFKDGNMLYYIGKELSYMPDKKYMNLEMMVDPDGDIIAYDKIVNGERLALSGQESKEIIEHARELEKIVSTRTASNSK